MEQLHLMARNTNRSLGTVGLNASCYLVLIAYACAYFYAIRGKIFRADISTDDARQQSYVFHQVNHPELFTNDFVTEAMKSYLAPAHYWLSYFVTLFTADPVMTGHVVGCIQLSIALIALFFFLRDRASVAAGCLGVIWFLQTHKFVRTMTGGLPRGWMAPLIFGFLYLLAKRKHVAIVTLLGFGIILNPPATFVCMLTYGIVLMIEAIQTRRVRCFYPLLLASPLYLLATLSVLNRPEFVGEMVSYEQAASMPSFSRAGGRFAFLPFSQPKDEILFKGLYSFYNKRETPFGSYGLWLALGVVFIPLLCVALRKERRPFLRECTALGFSGLLAYFLARALAFRLYVPERYLLIPLGAFCITATLISLWHCFSKTSHRCFGILLLSFVVYYGGGSGIGGHLNYNIRARNNADLYQWVKQETFKQALIAGNPTHIDAIPLFGMRAAYITTETAHPFFDRYWKEAKRRLTVTWTAYYSDDIDDFLDVLRSEDITHFIFKKSDFFPKGLEQSTYFKPFDQLVKNLSNKDPKSFVYETFLANKSLKPLGVTPFRSRKSLVIDIVALEKHREHLKELHRKRVSNSKVDKL